MKKMLSLLLALVLAVGLFAGCGNNNDVEETVPEATQPVTDDVVEETVPETTEAPAEVSGSLAILENIWKVYGENERFPAMGGDANNMVDGAPGEYGLEDVETLGVQLLVPADQVANIDEAASLFHGMMLNNFTCGVFHVTSDVDAFAETMVEAVQNNQWLCGMPEAMLVAVVDGEYVVMSFGLNDTMKVFNVNLGEAYPYADVKYVGAIE